LQRLRRDLDSGRSASVELVTAPAIAALADRHPLKRWIWAAGVLVSVLVISAAAWLRFGRYEVEVQRPPPKIVPLTGNPGREMQPAISPDGKQVAYSWNGGKGGDFSIYVKLIGAGTPLRLTSGSGLYPAWSPDGRYIAFVRVSTDGSNISIFVVPALGGPERRLGGGGGKPAWSPDGKFVAIGDRSSPKDPWSIFLLSHETGEKRRLTLPPTGSLYDVDPAFSPDGKTLAFTRVMPPNGGDIYLLPLTGDGSRGGEPKQLTFEGRAILGLEWSADGRQILFSSNRAGGSTLWRIPISGGNPERLLAGGETAVQPSLSRQGNQLAYVRQLFDRNIWRMELPTSDMRSKLSSSGWRAPAPTQLIASKEQDFAPQSSPDEKKIVFTSNRSGNQEIWVCDSDGLNPVQLTSFGGPFVGTPRWSSDGQRIAFDSTKEGHREIYVINADGGAPRRLTIGTFDNVRPSWSSDGRWIYFGSIRSGTWQVWKAPVEGGEAVQVTKNGGREAFESRDGKFVYYSKFGVPAVPGIWRVATEGGEETQVLDEGTQNNWALLDDGICFLDTIVTPPVIKFFSFSTRRLEPIVALSREVMPQGGFDTPSLAVSPDGRWLFYVQADRAESEIMLVENFR
jgi:eukaryotic-like serine/threonine-protein kinase